MNSNKKQKVVKSNTEYSQSQEPTEFQTMKTIIKNSASRLGSEVWNYFQPSEKYVDYLSSIHASNKTKQSLVEWIINSAQALENFKLNEVFLANTLCSYPHMAENIHDDLIKIIDNWDISNK
ncbi:23886_t:CDS:2, partial [Gigaspora rosea]